MQAPDSQLQTLRLYKLLIDQRQDWGGALVFSCGPEAPRSGLAPAASIAGAAALLVDADGHEIKKAFRRGEIDFVVNSLDEAVRTLKNELRRKRSLSVAVIGEVEATVAEMVERGLQPDVFLASGPIPACVQPLLDRGMSSFVAAAIEDAQPQSMRLYGEDHPEFFLAAKTPTKLREADERVLRMLARDEAVRRRWSERAPHYLRAATDGRWVYLSEAEAMLLESEGLVVRPVAAYVAPPEATQPAMQPTIVPSPEESLPTAP